MSDDLIDRLQNPNFTDLQWPRDMFNEAAARIEALEAALLEIFDHECRISVRSFIACTARGALWPRAALAGEKKDG